MAARHCTGCGKNHDLSVTRCDVCNTATRYAADEFPDVAAPPSTEWAKVEGWRLKELIDADYPTPLAERLAVRRDVDLHLAVDLVKQGCRPELAAEILL
jgi:hypothetical protein